MKRSFNYTDRKKILREDFVIEWIDGKEEEPASFKAELDFSRMENLREDAEIWVEARSGPLVARYFFGTVFKPMAPADTTLSVFPRGLKPQFRIKVVDPDDPRCRILAFAQRITPAEREEIESGRQSILPVEYVDLGQQIWNLRMDNTSSPILELNREIEEPVSIRALANTPEFHALVYPAVIREIFSRLLLQGDDLGSNADHDWLSFGRNLVSVSAPEYETYDESLKEDYFRDVREWIDDVVKRFCESQQTRSSYVNEKSTQYQDG